ncbi:MAG: hypothetical protein QXK88_06435 [Desulfurococcaceae archaeon]
MLRELSYMFVQSKKVEQFSTLSRLFTAAFILVFLTCSRLGGVLEVEIARITIALTLVIAILSKIRGLRAILSGVKLLFLFTLAGALVLYASRLVGLLAPDPYVVPLGALRLVAFFLSFSLFFQLISLNEWKYLLTRLGFRSQALILSVVIAHIPLVLNYVSESFITIRLKYKGKKLYKVVVPLTLLSLYTARGLYEANLLYGSMSMPSSRLTLFKRGDIALYAVTAALGVAGLLPF